MILKKKSCPKTAQMIADDIRYSFQKLTSQNNPILSITINNTDCKTAEELRFSLTNRLFNKICFHPFLIDYNQLVSSSIIDYNFSINTF